VQQHILRISLLVTISRYCSALLLSLYDGSLSSNSCYDSWEPQFGILHRHSLTLVE